MPFFVYWWFFSGNVSPLLIVVIIFHSIFVLLANLYIYIFIFFILFHFFIFFIFFIFFCHPHFSIRIFPSAICIRHPQPSGPRFTDTPKIPSVAAFLMQFVYRLNKIRPDGVMSVKPGVIETCHNVVFIFQD